MSMRSLVLLTLRVLAGSFAVVGATFLLQPDETLRSLDAIGRLFGEFAPTPATGARLWLSLAVAYMVLVTLLAALAQHDLARARPYLALLFAGKASSSLLALGAYRQVAPSFPYLANFVVDGAIALGVAAIFVAAPRLARAEPTRRGVGSLGRRDARILRAVLEALAPAGAGLGPEHAGDSAAGEVEAYVREAGGLAGLRALLLAIEVSPFVLPPLWLRPFSSLALEDRARVLQAFEDSRLAPRRQALAVLKLLALPQVYGRPEVLRSLGYREPLERVPLDAREATP